MAITLTSKQRAYLRGLASTEKPIFSIGKSNLTPEITNAVAEAFANREIIKVNILKSTADEQDEEGLRNIGEILAERTGAVLVCNIGRKLVLYKPFKESSDKKDKKYANRIKLPK
ncbi:MAG: YhbY family RNA-binding protein [Lachnospiraceae bacterium]|nr:YhbY family RNA-binding protein [Lachnospiraceae bacterium]